MKLYEIPAAMDALIDPDTGEITDMDAMMALNMERNAKIEGLALAWKNADAMEKALRDEKKSLESRITKNMNAKRRLAEFLRIVLDGKKFETARCAVRFQKTPLAVKIADGQEENVVEYLKTHSHEDCLRYKPPEIDKKALKEVVVAGTEVPGVTLEQGVSTRIV